jgi:hypothetical protein
VNKKSRKYVIFCQGNVFHAVVLQVFSLNQMKTWDYHLCDNEEYRQSKSNFFFIFFFYRWYWNGTTWSLEGDYQKDLKILEKYEIFGWFL